MTESEVQVQSASASEVSELIIHNENSFDHDYCQQTNDPNELHKKALESASAHVRLLKKQNNLLKNKNSSIMSGNLPKTVQDNIVHNVLVGKGYFTGKQCQQFCKPKKTEGKRDKKGRLIIKARNWPNEDLLKGGVISEGISIWSHSKTKLPNHLPLILLRLKSWGH